MAVQTELSSASLTSSCRNNSSAAISNLCCGKEVDLKVEDRWLGNFEEVPEYQRRSYILRHYRLEAPRMRHFWLLHNEFGNMWTHLVALVLTLARFGSWLHYELQHSNRQRFWDSSSGLAWPRQIYAAGVVSFYFASLLTFGISVMYHWRQSGKEREVKCWLCLDISCCALLLLVGFIAGVPMGFHCHPELQKGYMLQAITVALAALGAFASESHATRGHRSSHTLILGGISALWPALHWLILSTEGREAAGAWLVLVIISGSFAATFYTKNIPECFAPGRFDLLCNSHQLWHIFIYVAIAAYGEALVVVFKLTASSSFCR